MDQNPLAERGWKSRQNTSKPDANPRRSSGPGFRFRGPGSGLSVDDILKAARPEGAAAAQVQMAGVYIGSDKDAIKQAIDQERVSRGFGPSKDDVARYVCNTACNKQQPLMILEVVKERILQARKKQHLMFLVVEERLSR